MIVSGYRSALDLDAYPLSNVIRPRCAERAKSGRNMPVLIMCIGFFACFHVISLKRLLFSCPCSTEAVGIAHNPPRSLYYENSRTHTDTQTIDIIDP